MLPAIRRAGWSGRLHVKIKLFRASAHRGSRARVSLNAAPLHEYPVQAVAPVRLVTADPWKLKVLPQQHS